jgi:hypothetical protein
VLPLATLSLRWPQSRQFRPVSSRPRSSWSSPGSARSLTKVSRLVERSPWMTPRSRLTIPSTMVVALIAKKVTEAIWYYHCLVWIHAYASTLQFLIVSPCCITLRFLIAGPCCLAFALVKNAFNLILSAVLWAPAAARNVDADDNVAEDVDNGVAGEDEVPVEAPVVTVTTAAPLRRSSRVAAQLCRALLLRSRSQYLCSQRSSSLGATRGQASSELQALSGLSLMEKVHDGFKREREAGRQAGRRPRETLFRFAAAIHGVGRREPTILSRGGDTTKLLNAQGWLARANPQYTYDLVTFLS